MFRDFQALRAYNFRVKNAWKFWMKSGLAISIVLFFWMFSYWGDHGLGDSARIPIGHGNAVREINASNAYIEVSGEQYGIGKFTYNDEFFCAEYSDRPTGAAADYLIWNLSENMIQPVQETAYLKGIDKLGFPDVSTFREFAAHYEQ